jgi:DNA-directed RNA polymerase sigma subunit (sigma70/sigma32)
MTLRERFLNQQDPTYIRSRRAYQMKCVENRTLRAIGAELDISRERARQLVAKYKKNLSVAGTLVFAPQKAPRNA